MSEQPGCLATPVHYSLLGAHSTILVGCWMPSYLRGEAEGALAGAVQQLCGAGGMVGCNVVVDNRVHHVSGEADRDN
jgi:hypothetical protein